MKLGIDLLTRDEQHNEIAIYLVEDGPWLAGEMERRLRDLQSRLNGTLDVILSGELAKRHPESHGARLRIQVDLHGNAPSIFADLVRAFGELLNTDDATRLELARAREFVEAIRVVTREDVRRK